MQSLNAYWLFRCLPMNFNIKNANWKEGEAMGLEGGMLVSEL